MYQTQAKLLTTTLIAALATFATTQAQASPSCGPANDKNYSLMFSVGGVGCSVFSTDTADQFLDKLSTSGLSSLNNAYNGTQDANISASFNALGMNIAYPNAGYTGTGATLNFSIPGLNEYKIFTGTDRDDTKRQLSDYLKKSNLIGKIMKWQSEHSPVSPLTGAGGLLPSTVSTDFNQNFTDSATNIAAPVAAVKQDASAGANLIGAALSYSSLKSKDRDTDVISIPLSYTIRNDMDPRRQLVLSLPITQIDTAGAKSYHTGLGVAYRMPMNDNWTLTPSGRISVVGSKDLATVAGLYSFSLTSTYIWTMPDFDVAMGNMIGYNQTAKVKSGDYSFDPDIQSTVLRNGVMLSQPVTLAGKKMSVEYSLVDTRYLGDKLYMDNTQELSITLGTNKRAYSSRSFFRAGLTYLHGKDTDGFTLNFGYWF